MIVYKCDNCKTDIDPRGGYGVVDLRKGNLIVRVQGYVFGLRSNREGQSWASPEDDSGIQLCQNCVITAAREGEVITEWPK